MYNEETKRIFLSENPGIGKSAWLFEAVSGIEKDIGLDIAEASREDVLRALSALQLDEPSTVSSAISTMKAYAKWRQDRNLAVNQSGLLSIGPKDIDISATLGRVLIKDEADLLESIGLVRSFDDGRADVVVLVLGWLGLQKSEILALRDWDVNLQDRAIYGPGGTVLSTGFSDRVCDIIERYRNCRVSSRELGLHDTEVIKDLSVDSFLKKMLPRGSSKFGSEYTQLQLDRQINDLAVRYQERGFPRRHTFTNVWRSGRFHALWEIEQTGVDVTAKENRPIVESTMRNRKNYYNALKMYEAYKQAFYK